MRLLISHMNRFGIGLSLTGLLFAAALSHPQAAFAYSVTQGRLELYSDRPFSPDRGRAILADVEHRLAISPLNDKTTHRIFVTNTSWRRALAFATAGGASGVNYHPLTSNVFIRQADIDRDRVVTASGREAEPPRTLAYYATHEITHSLTGERQGAAKLWNRSLPRWVREGYADYVGMGITGEVDELFRRLRAGDPALSFRRSHQYAQYRLLVAYRLERLGWSVPQLLASRMPEVDAQEALIADLTSS